MAVVGGYTIDLYCDTGDDVFGADCPHRPLVGSCFATYSGLNERDCLRQARRDGWTFREGNTKAFCPSCSKK